MTTRRKAAPTRKKKSTAASAKVVQPKRPVITKSSIAVKVDQVLNSHVRLACGDTLYVAYFASADRTGIRVGGVGPGLLSMTDEEDLGNYNWRLNRDDFDRVYQVFSAIRDGMAEAREKKEELEKLVAEVRGKEKTD